MNYFEEIESYLDGSMNEQNRKAFEAELLRNPELSRETQLRREVEALLASGPEDALRQNLDILGERYTETAPNRIWIWVSIAVLMAAVLVWLMLQNPDTKPVLQPVSPSGPAVDTTASEPQLQNQAPLKKEVNPAEPIAANFTPNPALESMIGSQLRDGGLKISILSPEKNARLKTNKGSVSLQFSGRVDGVEKMEDAFQLKVYSNKKADYEENRTLLSVPLVFFRDEQHFNFQVLHDFRLAPGLYYYLIENEESGAVNVVEKFEVR